MCCPLPGHSTDEFADRYYVGNYGLWEGRIEYLIWGALLRISLDGPQFCDYLVHFCIELRHFLLHLRNALIVA